MSDGDKDQQLSSSISRIKDFGSGEEEADNLEVDFDEPDYDQAQGGSAYSEDFSDDILDENEDDFDNAPEYEPDDSQPASLMSRVMPAIAVVVGLVAIVLSYLGTKKVDDLEAELVALRAELETFAAGNIRQANAITATLTDQQSQELIDLSLKLETLALQVGDLANDAPTAVEVPPSEPEALQASSPAPPESAASSSLPAWYLNLVSFQTEGKAKEWAAALSQAPAQLMVVPIESGGGTLYRVSLGPFESRSEAVSYVQDLEARWELSGIWPQFR